MAAAALKIKAHYECHHCNRPYISKTSFDKHVRVCEILSASTERKPDDSAPIPTVRELYDIIKTLTIKYDMLESKIDRMQNWVTTNKKKLNVADWLNTNNSLTTNFYDWLRQLEFTSSDMELVFRYNYCEGIRFIIQRIFISEEEQEQSGNKIPIKAFEQRDNTIFIYNEDEWTIMTPEQFEVFFKTINKGLILQFKAWQDANRERLCETGFTETYAENAKKIFGGELTLEQQYTKIKRVLYNHIKINIKSLIQYEYEF